MSATLELILTIADFIVALIVIVSILFQSSESEGLSGVLSGSAETLFGKDKKRSLDSKLSKVTTIAAIVFIIITFILCVGSPKASTKTADTDENIEVTDSATNTDVNDGEEAATPTDALKD